MCPINRFYKDSSLNNSKQHLKDIYYKNLDIIQDGGYETIDGFVEIDDKNLRENSIYYHNAFEHTVKTGNNYDTKIYVQNIDSFDKAQQFGMKCAVLNMASSYRPGGGVRKGSKAQEECLCRKSNLVVSLTHFSEDYYNECGWNDISEQGQYPMKPFDGIWSPEVTVFRRSNDYKLLSIPFTTNVISVAGVRKPNEYKGTHLTNTECDLMTKKISSILNIAIINNIEILVLGALSCGAFGCLPTDVAQIFKNVLDSPMYKHQFKEICFAIIEDKNSPSGGNIKPFADIFGQYEIL